MDNKILRHMFWRKSGCGLLTAVLAIAHTVTGTRILANTPINFTTDQDSAHDVATRQESPEESLRSCYNAKFNPVPAPFLDFVEGRPSQSLFLHRVWWSKRNTAFVLSTFTSLDSSRLQMLESQCRSFPGGVVSAGVWLPLVEPPQQPLPTDSHGEPQLSPANSELLANVTARLEDLYNRMEAVAAAATAAAATAEFPSGSGADGAAAGGGGVCSLRLLLVVEVVADDQMAAIMPINTIRNAAFLAVDSPLAAMVDVDLSISAGLANKVLTNQTRVEELLWRSHWEHAAWVLPTFDVHHNVSPTAKDAVVDEVLAVPPEEKTTTLWSMWQERHRIHPFAADRYIVGHNATNYNRWFVTNDEYPSGFQEGYEPWFMAARRAMPPYDVRIRGRYHDKITNVRHSMKRLAFMVTPDAWLVHRPHGLSPSHLGYRNTHTTGSWPLEKMIEHNGTVSVAADLYLKADQRFFKDVIRRTNDNSYEAVVDETWDHCRAALSWWRGSFPLGPGLTPTLLM